MNMAGTFNIILFIAGISIIRINSSFDCSKATQQQCGSGLCINRIWSNATCLPYTNIYCSQGSKWSNSTQNCIQCSNLANDQCTVICSDFYWSQGSSNSTHGCFSCKAAFGQGCSSCNDMTCTSCLTLKGIGLQLSGTTCIDPFCGINNCLECSSKTTCGLCNSKFIINNDATSCVSSSCSEPYCTACVDATCTGCAMGYGLVEGKCKLNCNDKNCIDCSQADVCGQCKIGFVLNPTMGTCVVDCTNTNIANCYQCLDGTKCQSCLSGFKLSFGGTQCTPICDSSRCDICSTNSSVCVQCIPGYKLEGTACQDDLCLIAHCISCASTTACATCASNYAYDSTTATCEPTCKNVQPNCLVCSSATVCSSCGQGYKMVSSSAVQCQPLCSISNCHICASQTQCLSCKTGYKLSADGLECKLDCGVHQCDICSSSTKCNSCNLGYTLSSENVCLKSCKNGFINVGGNSVTCQSCQAVITYCESCAKVGEAIVCTACPMTYYLATSTSCLKCSTAMANCLSCSSRTQCTSCVYPFVLQADGSCANVPCSVKNCQSCSKTSQNICATCVDGFILQSDGSCLAPSCPQGSALMNGVCACGDGLYPSGGICVRCSDSKCTACSSASVCTTCAKGYYPSGSACLSCSNNCDVCSSSTTCTQCSVRFTLDGGLCRSLGQGVSAAKKDGKFVPCEPGCASCEISATNEIICTTVQKGYSSLGGIYTKCGSTCMTCAISQPNTCTSCFQSNVLVGGICMPCTDPRSLSCLGVNRNYSLSCLDGYSASATSVTNGGYCLPCAQNCSKCQNTGPGNCDKGQCQLGFVILTGTNNCTACFNSCSICDTDDLNKCLDCGPKRYSQSGQCFACPSGCKMCSSSTVCSGCDSGYSLKNTSCMINSNYPCSLLSDSGQCSDCFAGYLLNSSTKKCDKDVSCNTTSSCQVCPYGYYLNQASKTCTLCSLGQGCLTCDSLNSSKCVLCEKKYYLNQSGFCNSCPSNCINCISLSYCNQAAPGYYISLNLDGSSSGKSFKCNFPCLTCSFNPDFCLSCASGFTIFGTTCQSDLTINIKLVLGASSSPDSLFKDSDQSEIALKKSIRSANLFLQFLCSVIPSEAGQQHIPCKSKTRFKSLVWGSAILGFQTGCYHEKNVNLLQQSIDQGFKSKQFDGVYILKSHLIVISDDYIKKQPVLTANQSKNIILAVAVPLTFMTVMGVGYLILTQGMLISPAILQLKSAAALPLQSAQEINNAGLEQQFQQI